MAPWVGGSFLALDWVTGPNPTLARPVWGLEHGVLASVPFALGAHALQLLGGGGPASWLPVVLVCAVGGAAAGSLVGGGWLRRLPAGLLYVVNPLVYERLWSGHMAFLLGYALLPLAVRSALKAPDERGWLRLAPALWLTVLAGLSIHFAWIYGVIVVAVVAQRRFSFSAIRWAAASVAVVLVLNTYLLVGQGITPPLEVGGADLAAFRTRGDASIGLFGNVAALYGFWRTEAPLPKDEVAGWLLFLAALLLVAACGALVAWRQRHRLAEVLFVGAALGYLLALGDQGPTGPLFRWAFDHVPGFATLREPQKFVALVALAYACFFGYGVEALVRRSAGAASRVVWIALLVALPITYTPTLFWGLGGRIDASEIPSSWRRADRVMGDGQTSLLFLPWHQYMAFPFTGNRVIVNPASAVFERPVINGDNVELPGIPTTSRSNRSRYLEALFARGGSFTSFGALVAPLGIEYVALAKTVDWERYRWLESQQDLVEVFETDDLLLLRNTAAPLGGTRVVRVREVGSFAAYLRAVEAGAPAAGVVIGGDVVAADPLVDGADVVRRSPVEFSVPAGRPGEMLLPEPFDKRWRLDGVAPRSTVAGSLAFPTDGGEGVASFRAWPRIRNAYLVSAVSTSILGVLVLKDLRARRRDA